MFAVQGNHLFCIGIVGVVILARFVETAQDNNTYNYRYSSVFYDLAARLVGCQSTSAQGSKQV